MNIDCDMMLRNIDNSLDNYNRHIQKIMILQVTQKMFCEMLIGGRKVVNSDNIFVLPNIRTNVQEDSSEFEALIQEMISSEIFSNQEICHIYLNGEKRISSVSTYMKENLSIIEIENKVCQKCSKLNPPVKVVCDKLIMVLEGIPTNIEYRPIHHPKFTAIKKGTVVFDVIFQNISIIHCYTMCYVIIVHHLFPNE